MVPLPRQNRLWLSIVIVMHAPGLAIHAISSIRSTPDEGLSSAALATFDVLALIALAYALRDYVKANGEEEELRSLRFVSLVFLIIGITIGTSVIFR